MNSFTIGGIPYRILDLDAERGARTQHAEPYKPFTERALDEINKLPSYEKDHQFLVACSLYGDMFITADPNIILRFSLAGQVYNNCIRKMTLCDVLTVVYRDGKKFRPLQNWELRHFNSNDTPAFLDRERLEMQMKSIFNTVKISLGELSLTNRGISCPAWQITTEKGIYFLPWHSGSIIENTDKFAFKEKDFSEIKDTSYAHLRFAAINADKQVYHIQSC